jgi:dihydroxy-acid dehydratase
VELVASSAPSTGFCNTMGTATTMNSLTEAIGMSLPGSAAIPAPYRDRQEVAWETGHRIVEMVRADRKPSDIMTRAAFLNAICVNSAIGGSTNAPIHLNAIARHIGVELTLSDWEEVGADVPLLVNLQPAGAYLGEDFYRAGGVPAVMGMLLEERLLDGAALSVNGMTLADNVQGKATLDPLVIRPFADPLKHAAGLRVLHGNLFAQAVMKPSVISPAFRTRYLSNPDDLDAFEGLAAVFEGPEDYHARIDDPALAVDEQSILIIRGAGPIGYPGGAEVVNMRPPAALIRAGIHELPCIGDGRQSGTSGSPSILNASPEAAVGGGLALVRTGDRIRVDLKQGRVDMLVDDEELARRRLDVANVEHALTPESQTPWQEIQRALVGQFDTGAVLEPAVKFQRIAQLRPRNSH